MSVLKLSKNDIKKNDDSENKIKLKRDQLSYDSAMISGWETTNKTSVETLNNYYTRLNNNEWLSADDLNSYRTALDSYIDSGNRLRRLGNSYTEEEEKTWNDSISSMNTTYDSVSKLHSNFKTGDDFNAWYKKETFIDAYIQDSEKAKTDFEYDQEWLKEAENRKEINTVKGYEDFTEYATQGGAIKNPTYKEAEGWFSIGAWRPFGEEIGNIVTFSRDNIEAIASAASQANNSAQLANILGDYRYQFMTDDDVAVYNYYLGKGDKESADKYLQSIDGRLNQEWGKQMAENAKAANLEWFMAINTGLDQWASGVFNLDNLILGTEADPISASQYAGSIIREDIESDFWKGAWDLGVTISNQLPSILVGTITGGIGGNIAMGASIAGNAYAEMRNLGYNANQARVYSGLVTAAEMGLQYVMGGYKALGGKLSGGVTELFASKVDNAIAKFAIRTAGSMLSEGAEEAVQSILEPTFKSFISGEKYDVDWDEVIYSGILGALSAGMLEGVPNVIGTGAYALDTYKTGKDFKNAGGNISEIASFASNTFAADTVAYKLAGKVDENTGTYNIGKLLKEAKATLTEQNVADITKSLNRKGIKGKAAENYVNALAAVVEGYSLTEEQISALDADKAVAKTIVDVIINPNSTVNQRMQGFAESMSKAIPNSNANAEMAKNGSIASKMGIHSDEDETAEINTEESAFSHTDDGKTYLKANPSEEVSIKEISSIKDGEVFVRLENGNEVNAKEVDFGSKEEALMYEMVANLGVAPETAMSMMATFEKGKGTVSAEAFRVDAPLAYNYGKIGYLKGLTNLDLTGDQKVDLFGLGRKAASAEAQAKQTALNEKKATVSNTVKKKSGKVTYLDGAKAKGKRRKSAVKLIEVLSESIGNNWYVFSSYVENGRRVYKDVDGKVKPAPNGKYDTATGDIYIDLNAGQNGEGLMVFTMAHELTHFIRQWSPAKFKVFADFLIERYGEKGVSVERLIQNKITNAEANGRELSYDEAYEEVIADSCETMLRDSNAIEKIAQLKAKDRTIWEKIKDFISRLVEKIRAAYAELVPDSEEANKVLEMKEAAEKLQALWTEALVDAGKTYSAISAEKTLSENGIIVDSNTNSASLMSVRDVLSYAQKQKVSTALASRFGVTQQEAMDWLDAETSMASLILNPKYSQYLDYEADPNEVAIKQNADYPQGTVDFSPICAKRREFTSVMNNILRIFPNHVFAATDLAKIRTIMQEEGMTIPCGICYVEDRRQLDTIVAQNFIDSLKLYREGSETRPDGKAFNANQLKGLKLIDGDSYTPSVYELVSLEGLNALKEKDPNMAEAWVKFNNARGMQSVRLLANEAEYKRQILNYSKSTVKSKNDKGGLRIYSFSDAEMFHLIDIIQVITDSATVGLTLQGYTKVNEYAKTVKDTGEKLNRSLIPKGELGYHIENGKVILDYDTVEGIDINHPDFFDNRDNPDIGNITIGINDVQIRAAMVSDFVDQIIPFHTGQSEEVLGEKGISTWTNYKDFQTEKDIATGKVSDHQINIYTEVLQVLEKEGKPITKRTFVEKFLQVCKENSLTPRFSQFLNTNEKGEYVYTEGYHKFLVDFKTFAQTEVGEYLPQKPVKPIFDNQYINKILKDYVKSQKVKDAEIAKSMPKVIERITNEIVKPSGMKYSDRATSWRELDSIQGLEGYSVDDVVEIVKDHIERLMEYEGEDAKIITIRPYGSRARGTAKNSSDLDVVVQYEGDIREDDMFSILNYEDDKLFIDGIEVDINPIKADDTGTVEEYLDRVYSYDKYKDGMKYSVRDSAGNQLSKGQQEYFKDSKVRDEEGRLIPVYHGTETGGFTVFSDSHSGEAFWFADKTTAESYINKSYMGDKHWTGKGVTALYIGYLNITNPLIVDAEGQRAVSIPTDIFETDGGRRFRHIDDIAMYAKDHGYDGLIVRNVKDYGMYTEENLGEAHDYNLPTGTVYAVFESNQFKNADNKAPTENPDIRYSDRDFASQVDAVLSGADTNSTHLKVMETPSLLQQAGLPSLPVLMTAKHLKSITSTEGKGKANYHGLDVEMVKKLPEYISDPVMIADSFTRNDSVVIITEVVDSENRPVIAAIMLNGEGRLDKQHIKANIMTSAYGRSNFQAFIDRIADENAVIYWNKKKSQDLSVSLGIQFPNAVTSLNSNTIIRKAKAFVKGNNKNSQKFSDRNLAPTFYSQMGKVVDGMKQDKFAANSVVSMLRGRGVKADEIRWSGIAVWLEGKKSVTKQELQEFIQGSQLQIGEQMSDPVTQIDLREGGADDYYAYKLYDKDGNVLDTFIYDYAGELESEETGETFLDVETLREELQREYGNGNTRWSQYKLGGGSNYREIVFTLPNSTYSNRAMKAHWGQDAEGVLVHARIQDFVVNGKNMLFIEELQSDWHNEGHSKGYSTKEYEDAVESHDKLYNEYKKMDLAFHKYVRSNEFMTDSDDVRKKKHDWLRGKVDTAQKKYLDAEKVVNSLKEKGAGDTPDAPFKDNYHEYVLKRLLRMAAEQGYDSIGWTPAEIQVKRWSEKYAEGYRIEYDQEMPKFLKKYGRQWGATVGKVNLLDDAKRSKEIADLETDLMQMEDAVKTTYGADRRFAEDAITDLKEQIANLRKGHGGKEVWNMDLTDSMKDSVLHEGQMLYSDRVTDKKTLDFLNNQETLRVYRAMQVIDGKLYPPMAAKVKSADGKKNLVTPSEIGAWEQAVERPDLIRNGNKFELDKANGSSIQAAYNPYFHTSASPLNDQFTSAYKRENLVVVEGEIPVSELTSGYRAEFAKDTVGETKWHSGVVASKLKGDKARKVYLSRWFKPVRIVPDAEVATKIAETLEGENIDVPYNVVTPSLRTELEKAGVSIKYSDRNADSVSNRSLLANALESAAQNDIERNKLAQYKEKIELINSEEKKLHELREQIKEISFAKGRRDIDKLKSLQFEAHQAANRINTYDRQLLNLEASKPLKDVLEREKQLAYKKAEKKGKEALAAYREKTAKTTRELITRYQESRAKATEGRHKTELRHKIKKVVGDLNHLLLHGTKEKNIKLGLQEAVASALDAINMDTVSAESRIAKLQEELMRAKTPEKIEEIQHSIDYIRNQGDNLADKLEALRKAYSEIKRGENQNYTSQFKEEASLIHDRIETVIKEVGDTPLRDMSIYQLNAVYEMYTMVLNTIRMANGIWREGKLEDLQQNASAVMGELEAIQKLKDEEFGIKSTIREYSWNEMTPYYAFQRIGSKTFTKLFWDFVEAQNVYAKDASEAKAFADATRKKYGYKKWNLDKVFEFKCKDGRIFKTTLKHMLSIYAYSKRDQALPHMEQGGFFHNDKATFRKKHGILELRRKDEVGYKIDEEILEEIKGAMTKDQLKYVDEMQEYLTKMGEKGNEVTRIMWGIDIFKEKVYFPLKSKDDFIKKSTETAQSVSLKNDGMTKETVPNASNPIVLEAFDDVWASHVDRMSQYHSFVIPIDNLNKVHQYGTWAGTDAMSVSTMLTARFGSEVNEYLSQFIKDLNGNVMSQGARNPIAGFFTKFKKTAVGASLSTVIQQPTAILRAMALIDSKYFVGKPNTNGLSSKWEELKKYAPVALIKEIGGFDAGAGKPAKAWLNNDALRGVDKVMNTIDNIAMKGAEVADQLGWTTIWEAVKREVKANNPDLAVGSETFLEKCGKRFTEVIVQTQVYDSTLSKSGFMRSKNDGVKMLTAFMGEPTLSINMMYNAIIQAKRGGKGAKTQAARTMASVYASIIASSAAASLIYALRDDDEDESYLEKYLQAFGGEVISDIVLAPITSLPAIKDIVSIFQGWDVERSDVSIFKDIKDAFDGLSSENKSTYRKIEDFAGAIASAVGIPLKNLLRTGREIYNLFDNIFDGIEGGDMADAFLEGITDKDKSKSDKLYDAIVNGDEARLEIYKRDYKDESTYETALRKALRENDSRIREAAQARVDGDMAEYKRIAKEIIAEGNFVQDIIVGAINAEINAIKREEADK